VPGTDLSLDVFALRRRRAIPRNCRQHGAGLDTTHHRVPPAQTSQRLPRRRVEIDPNTGGRRNRALTPSSARFRPTPQPASCRGPGPWRDRTGHLGQALIEHAVYDQDSGQPFQARSWTTPMRARRCSALRFIDPNVPRRPTRVSRARVSRRRRRAPPAVINAIVDVPPSCWMSHIDMPATPPRVWGNAQRNTKRPYARVYITSIDPEVERFAIYWMSQRSADRDEPVLAGSVI